LISVEDCYVVIRRVQTAYYTAPEVIEQKYGKMADMWSMGVVMFVMLHGYPCFYADPAKYGIPNFLKFFFCGKKSCR